MSIAKSLRVGFCFLLFFSTHVIVFSFHEESIVSVLVLIECHFDIRSFNSEVNDVEILVCNIVDALLIIGCDALSERYDDDRVVFISEDDFPCNLVCFGGSLNGLKMVLLMHYSSSGTLHLTFSR